MAKTSGKCHLTVGKSCLTVGIAEREQPLKAFLPNVKLERERMSKTIVKKRLI